MNLTKLASTGATKSMSSISSVSYSDGVLTVKNAMILSLVSTMFALVF